MARQSVWHQIESDGRLLEQLPQHERDALRYEVSLSPRNTTSYRFERPGAATESSSRDR